MSTVVREQSTDLDVPGIYRRHLSAGRVRIASLIGGQVEVSGRGAVVTDTNGVEYINCGGYGVFLLGHCHPRVVEAVQAQVARHPCTTRLLLDPVQALAAQSLATLTPEGMDRVYFATSGTDAVEAGLKLARMHGKRRVIAAEGGFHGKTMGALSASGNPTFREPFEPLVPGVRHVPFGDAAAIARAVADAPGECCVLIEPIQGEGGVRIPPDGYLRAVSEACREHGALLILDEIATGLGRVGEAWFACEKEGVVPDVALVGKPLSGGIVPVSAIVATEEAFAPLDRDPFIHSATFSGSPIAMAAIQATVEVLVEERVAERARDLGTRIVAGLHERLADQIEDGLVAEIRGAGLLIGIDFDTPAAAGEFEIELVGRRLIPNHCLNSHSVVRLTPSALMSDSEVEWILDAAEGSARAVHDRRRSRAGRR